MLLVLLEPDTTDYKSKDGRVLFHMQMLTVDSLSCLLYYSIAALPPHHHPQMAQWVYPFPPVIRPKHLLFQAYLSIFLLYLPFPSSPPA